MDVGPRPVDQRDFSIGHQQYIKYRVLVDVRKAIPLAPRSFPDPPFAVSLVPGPTYHIEAVFGARYSDKRFDCFGILLVARLIVADYK